MIRGQQTSISNVKSLWMLPLLLMACEEPVNPVTSVCGNGILEESESCDDGNFNEMPCPYGDTSCQTCSDECQLISGSVSFCGDGVLQAEQEECDEPGADAYCEYGDTECWVCGVGCRLVPGIPSFCGDGQLDADQGEECDGAGVVQLCSYGESACDVCGADCRWMAGATRFCGDGIVQDEFETCDDGNVLSGDYCSGDCAETTGQCGDGIQQTNEACDDGNTENGDYCRSDCRFATGSCGDGILQGIETCDDGNTQAGDYCSANCQFVTGSCGDNIIQRAEICDDGNRQDGDYCRSDCSERTGFCGDGLRQSIEACDDGNTASGDYCSPNCAVITGSCGDGEVQPNEICDDGNAFDGDYCAADCASVTGSCGDGERQENEVCDDGNEEDGDYCAADCKAITGYCGDSIQQSNELCDDGNDVDGDYCRSDCLLVTGACGDDIVQEIETCDDGNLADGDYCSATCQQVTGACGDDITQNNEACDDGNVQDGDYCSADCFTITGRCGDGTQQTNESCDDGNQSNSDSCLNDCTPATCGDGYVWADEEDCDDALEYGGTNGACFSCQFYCDRNDELIYLDHNDNIGDGCEEEVYARTMGEGATELRIHDVDVNPAQGNYVAGAYSGILDSRVNTSMDGYLQKQNHIGAIDWALYLHSSNAMLPANKTYTDEWVGVASDASQMVSIGHYCENTDSNLGVCIGYIEEPNAASQGACDADDDCQSHQQCNFETKICSLGLDAGTDTGARNGVVVSMDHSGNYQWSVQFRAVRRAHNDEYAFAQPAETDSEVTLKQVVFDDSGNVYVAGNFGSSMDIITSADQQRYEERPTSHCELDVNCDCRESDPDCDDNFPCSDAPICGVDCNNDGVAAFNECEIENQHDVGFVAKLKAQGQLVWLKRLEKQEVDTLAVSPGQASPELAVGGTEWPTFYSRKPFLQVFQQDATGPKGKWKISNALEVLKSQSFDGVQFDSAGGLWARGWSPRSPASPITETDLPFHTCSFQSQPTPFILQFDGNDEVKLPAGRGLGYTNEFSVLGWVYLNPNPSGVQTIWGGGASYTDSHMLFISDHRLRFQRCHSGGTCNVNLNGTARLQSGRWHHFAFIRNGEIAKIYLDGNLDAEGGNSTWNTSTNDSDLYLGRRSRTSEANHLNGDLDEVGIWHRELSQNEIRALMEGESWQENSSGLAAYYTMSFSGTQLLSENNDAHGTLAGATPRYEEQNCETPADGCPAFQNRSMNNSCATEFEDCAVPCFEGDAGALSSCLDGCGGALSGAEASLYDTLMQTIEVYPACSGNPVTTCLQNFGSAPRNVYLKCVAPNAEGAFVAHFESDGRCDFNQFFHSPSAAESAAVVPTRLGAMDVVGNDVWVMSYASGANADSSVLSHITPGASAAIDWQYEWLSGDSTPILGTSLHVLGDFAYASLTYSTELEMSIDVDFVSPESLSAQACTTSSCNDTGLLWKARLPAD